MRIIGGIHKGKTINAPKNLPVRPTTDFAKTGLFNILANRIDFEDIDVLDLFSGTGNISMEFASRQAKSVLAVDVSMQCIKFVQEQAFKLPLPNLKCYKTDVFNFIKKPGMTFDLVFADPPYEIEKIETIPDLVESAQLVRPGGLFVFEHGPKHNFKERAHFLEQRSYGNVNFSIFKY